MLGLWFSLASAYAAFVSDIAGVHRLYAQLQGQ